jgi:hypothetical protein
MPSDGSVNTIILNQAISGELPFSFLILTLPLNLAQHELIADVLTNSLRFFEVQNKHFLVWLKSMPVY